MAITQIILNRIQNCDDGHVDLSNLNVKDADLPLIISMLTKVKDLKTLDVRRNGITAKGAELLATIRLKVLHISDNYLRDTGASALFRNEELRWLDVAQNGLTNSCIYLLLKNTNLIYVNLENNHHITDDMLNEVRQHIKKNVYKNQELEKEKLNQQPVLNKSQTKKTSKDELKEKAANDIGIHGIQLQEKKEPSHQSASSIKLFPPAPKDERKEKAANDTTEMKSPTNKNS